MSHRKSRNEPNVQEIDGQMSDNFCSTAHCITLMGISPDFKSAAGSDASVVRRTQARLQAQHKPTVHYSAYFTVPTRFIFLLFAFFGKLLEALAQFSWGRWLLLRFPRVFSYGLFSREGPTEQQMAQTRFEMRFIGHGYAQGTLSIIPSRKPCAHSCTTACMTCTVS